MKTRSKTSWTDPLRLATRCILGLILIVLIQAGNGAGPPSATAAPQQPIDATTAEALTNTDPIQPTHPPSANPLRRRQSADSPSANPLRPSCGPQSADHSSVTDPLVDPPAAERGTLSRLPANQSENMELLGRIGGSQTRPVVQGNYAYVGIGQQLIVLDISSPSQPMVVGQSPLLPESVGEIYMSDGYAYVTTGVTGLRVLNISDPTSPAEVGFYETPEGVGDVYVSGGYAYVDHYSRGIWVLDATAPSALEKVGAFDAPRWVEDVHVDGDYAYVTGSQELGEGPEGLWIVDITDPTAPQEVGFYETSRGGNVFATDGYAYLVWGDCGFTDCSGGLEIVDVSDPSQPVKVGAYATPDGASDVYIIDNYAFVVWGEISYGHWHGGLRIVEISDPSSPQEVGVYDTSGHASGIYVVGGYSYVSTGDGLQVIDVSDPTAPTLVGSTPGATDSVFVSGDLVYVAAGHGLGIIDVSNPSVPQQVGFSATSTSARGVYVDDNYAYVTYGYRGSGGVDVVDVSDPAVPVVVGTYRTPTAANSVYVTGGYAYVAYGYGPWGSTGLGVVDLSDPTAPEEVGAFEIPNEAQAQDVHVTGSYAYLIASDGLRVVDISDPVSPQEVGFYETPAREVYVSGDYAYVAGRGFRVMDISNPEVPQEVGFYETPGYIYGVHVSGTYAYVADASAGIRVLDVSEPTLPVEVGSYHTPSGALDVYAAGSYTYVANGGGGLFILRLTGDLEPTYSIAGQVTDAAGNPIPNASISATGPATASTTTASDGTYTLADLPAGTYSISAAKAGYLFSPTSHAVTVPPAATGVDFTGSPVSDVAADPANSSVAVSPDSVPADGTTEIQITVTLRDSDNNPVSGRVVQVLSSRGGQDTITQPATPTNAASQATATIRSDTAGTAELTVLDLTDDVELAQHPTVTFTPYTPLSGDFIDSVNRLADETILQLNNLDDRTEGIADEGTYFRLAIGEHLVDSALSATFGALDLVGGLSQLRQESVAEFIVRTSFG